MYSWRLAWRNIQRNMRRSLVTGMTVAAGAGALFLFDGFNTGILHQYKDNTIHAKYGYGQINLKGYRDGVFEKPEEHWIAKPLPVLSAMRSMPTVAHVFPRLEFYGLLTNGAITVSAKGMGIDGVEEADFFNTINIVSGETLRGQADGVIVGVGLAKALQVKPGDHLTLLGQTVYGSMNGAELTVTGIFHTGIKEIDDGHFRMQLVEAQKLLDTTSIESVSLGLVDDDSWPKVAEIIRTKFPELEATPFAVLDEVYYQHAVDWLGQQFAVIQLIILALVLLGILNTVSFTVLERSTEIGNLRANGEAKRDIVWLFLAEALVLGAIGAAVGLTLTWALVHFVIPDGVLMPPAPGLTRQYFVKVELQNKMAVVSMLMGVGTAWLGTLLSVVRRVRRPIGELLRHR